MTYRTVRKIRGIVLFGLLAEIPICAAVFAQDYASLTVHGTTYPSACMPAENQDLRDRLNSKTIPEHETAWRVLELILCAPKNKSNLKLVTELVPKHLLNKVESTGDRLQQGADIRSEQLVSDLMAAGRAWDADINVEEGDLVLQYSANEACVRSVRLSYAKQKWRVSKIGEACD